MLASNVIIPAKGETGDDVASLTDPKSFPNLQSLSLEPIARGQHDSQDFRVIYLIMNALCKEPDSGPIYPFVGTNFLNLTSLNITQIYNDSDHQSFASNLLVIYKILSEITLRE